MLQTPMQRNSQLNTWKLLDGMGMDLPPQGGDSLLEWHRTIKGTSSWFSPNSAEYPPPAPDGVVSGVTSNTNSSLTSKYLEHLKASLSQQMSFSTSKPLLASPSSRWNTKKTPAQKPTYRAAPSETEGMGGKLQCSSRDERCCNDFLLTCTNVILTINFNDLPLCEGKGGRDLIFCNYFNCHPVVLFRAADFAVRWENTSILPF